jgi:hypothetical protein
MEFTNAGSPAPGFFQRVLADYQAIDENNDRVEIKITQP